MKRTIVLLLAAAFLQVVYGQGQKPHAISDKKNTQSAKDASTPLPAPAVTKIQQQATAVQGDGTKEHSKGYFGRLFAPENIPNIVLALVAILGIGVAIRTLRVIERQTNATEDAVKATKDSVGAIERQAGIMERQMALQETLSQQWVEIDGWRKEGFGSRESNPPTFTIAADVSNPTQAPLTVKSISIRIVGEATANYELGNVLGPSGEPIKVTYSGVVKPEWLKAYEGYSLPLVVEGSVVFVDCFGKERAQGFRRACVMGPVNYLQDWALPPPEKDKKAN